MLGQLGNGVRGRNSTIPVKVTSPAVVTQVTFKTVEVDPVTLQPVTFKPATIDYTPGDGLTQDGVNWSVTTKPGCGIFDVIVSYTLGGVAQPDVKYPGGFTYGSPPEITPVSSSQSGNVFTASVTVKGDNTPTVQWEQSFDGSTWTDVPGATGTMLTVTVTKKTDFRATATNCWTGEEAVFSAVFTDDPPPRPPVDPPQNHTAETGGSATSDWAGLAVVAASLVITGGLALTVWRRRMIAG